MANLSHLTRKQQVLKHLKDRPNRWVNGTELATAEVGGSEGLRRLRELREAGEPIEERKHPHQGRDIHQYRYIQPIPAWNPTQEDLEAAQTTVTAWIEAMEEE